MTFLLHFIAIGWIMPHTSLSILNQYNIKRVLYIGLQSRRFQKCVLCVSIP